MEELWFIVASRSDDETKLRAGQAPVEQVLSNVRRHLTGSTMSRFQSLKYEPSETRRTLRDRFASKLAVITKHIHFIDPEATVTPDILAFQLLDCLVISHSADWVTADAAYSAAGLAENEPLDLRAEVHKGWLRQIWSRVEISPDIRTMARRAPTGAMDSFKSLVMGIHDKNYQFNGAAPLEPKLAALIDDVVSGRSDPSQMVVRTPEWIAARLWETGRARASSDAAALRHWVDLWGLLHHPALVPATVWSGADAQAFRDATLKLITSESALGDWTATRDLYIKQTALAHNVTTDAAASCFPLLPNSLIDRALWSEQPLVEACAYASLEAGDDLFGLTGLLLADVDAQDNAPGPHPMMAQIINLAIDRAELFIALLFQVRIRPKLLADLVLCPRSTALACFLITRWPPVSSAWDRDRAERDYRAGQSEAFTDAVAILGEHLRSDQADAREAAALLAWLHRRSGSDNVDELVGADTLTAALRRELASCPRAIVLAMAHSFDGQALDQGLGTPEFASVLDLADLGNLTDDLDADALISAYEHSLSTVSYTLSAHRVGVSGAAVLARLSARTPELRQRFLYPVDVRARLAARVPVKNPYTLVDELGRALRTHMRILCRAVVGGPKDLPADLVDALIAAVKASAIEHKEKGRIAAFAPHFEKPTIGSPPDRPLAVDLAAALGRLEGARQASLLAAIVETDEPMVLAQLLPIVPPGLRGEIDRRITALAPADAGTIRSLPEMQARIDELLRAGAAEAAARYIEAERGLKPLGKSQRRELVQFQNQVHLAFLREDWAAIAAMAEPPLTSQSDLASARETLRQFRGLTALCGPNRDPAGAKAVFADLFQKRPSLGFAINWFAAAISELLHIDSFALLDGDQARAGQQVINEMEHLVASLPADARDDVLDSNQALLLLALGEPSRALGILSTVTSSRLQDSVAAYRAVALARLGRRSEATATLDEAEYALGSTPTLAAARSHIAIGAPFLSVPAVSVYDNLVSNVASAIARFRTMNPSDQAQVLQQRPDSLESLLVEHVRAATDALTTLVPMMTTIQIDDCEDDLNAVLQRVLAAQIQFLGWSVADQSKGGYSANNNPGERDMLITRGSTILAIVEALICAKPLTQDIMIADLESHFQKLLGYGSLKIFFHLTYAYIEDKVGVMTVLETAAEAANPPGFAFLGRESIPHEDSRPPGFVARYAGDFGEVKVVFLVLNMGQQRQRQAARMAGQTKSRRASKRPKVTKIGPA